MEKSKQAKDEVKIKEGRERNLLTFLHAEPLSFLSCFFIAVSFPHQEVLTLEGFICSKGGSSKAMTENRSKLFVLLKSKVISEFKSIVWYTLKRVEILTASAFPPAPTCPHTHRPAPM